VSRKQTFAIEFSITGVNMVRVDKNRKNLERGDAILEFAAALPLFILLLAGIGIFSWLFWAQAAADVAAMRALQEASVNRGADAINPGAGAKSFQSSIGTLTGGRTAGAVGGASVSTNAARRMVHLNVAGSVRLSFGPLESLFNFGGGGAGRMWRFWPGPPNPWE
jgi:hypothetical protein